MLKTIGQRIAKARNDKKMSQLKLSHLTSYSQAILSAYETDRVCPSERALLILAKALEVKVAWLRYGEGKDEGATLGEISELERRFNALVNYLKVPQEIFHYNTKEPTKKNSKTITHKKRGRPRTIK
jgi:transcriptional regulator with XRE-family HTH domain